MTEIFICFETQSQRNTTAIWADSPDMAAQMGQWVLFFPTATMLGPK